MSALRELRRPSNLVGLGALAGIGASAMLNLWFIDSLGETSFHRIQAVWLLVGLVSGGLLSVTSIDLVRRLAAPGYIALILLLIAVLLFAVPINHSKRWLDFGPMRMQPSEFMKLSVILTLADVFDRARAATPWTLRRLGWPILLILIPFGLINVEPDLGTSLCVLLIGGSLILYEGVSQRTIIGGALVLLLLVPLAWTSGLVRDYQKGRVVEWASLDEEAVQARRTAPASQPEQALWAVGSGRWMGRGMEDARTSVLRHLPFVYTDFALAAWASVYGFVGTLGLLGLYFALLWWALHVADGAHQRFDALICAGAASLIFWQFVVNAGMVMGLLPVVGLTLPLMSYGGSSVLTVMMSCGLVLNVALRRRAHG